MRFITEQAIVTIYSRLRLRLRLLFIDPFGMTPARKLDFQQQILASKIEKIQYKNNNKLLAKYFYKNKQTVKQQ